MGVGVGNASYIRECGITFIGRTLTFTGIKVSFASRQTQGNPFRLTRIQYGADATNPLVSVAGGTFQALQGRNGNLYCNFEARMLFG